MLYEARTYETMLIFYILEGILALVAVPKKKKKKERKIKSMF